MLIKLRNAFFQFFHQPAGEGLGFCDYQLAELAAGASHGATPERRSRDMKPRCFQAKSYSRFFLARHVHDHKILRVSGKKLANSIAITQLLRIEAPT